MFSKADVIYEYSRRQAIDDQVLFDVKPELMEMKMSLAGWPTICLTQNLYDHLIDTPATTLMKNKIKYNYDRAKKTDEDYLKRYRRFRLKAVWNRFIESMLFHFEHRRPGHWEFRYNDHTLTNATIVKAIIHRDDDGQEVVTLMREWED